MRSVVLIVPTQEGVRQLLAQGLDYGCRPRARRQSDGRYLIVVYGPTDALVEELGRSFAVTIHEHSQVQPPNPNQPQFAGGVVPLGFGARGHT
jgi:hypothetical protein